MSSNIPAMLFIARGDHFKFLSVISCRHIGRAFLKSLNNQFPTFRPDNFLYSIKCFQSHVFHQKDLV